MIKEAKLIEWIIQFCKKQKAKHDELTKRKIKVLLDRAERFFTDVYILEMQKNGAIDFHPALYRQGYVRSYWAAYQAYQTVLEIILAGHLERNYSRLIKDIKSGAIAK